MLRFLHAALFNICWFLAVLWGFTAALGGFAVGFAASSRPMSEIIIAMAVLAFMAGTTPLIFKLLDLWMHKVYPNHKFC